MCRLRSPLLFAHLALGVLVGDAAAAYVPSYAIDPTEKSGGDPPKTWSMIGDCTGSIGGLTVSTGFESPNQEISGSCWSGDDTLWCVQSSPTVIYKIEFSDDALSTPAITAFEIDTDEIVEVCGGPPNGRNYNDWEACAQLDPEAKDELYVLSENGGTIIRITGLAEGKSRGYKVWNLEGFMPAETGRQLDGYGKGTGAEGLEFISNVAELFSMRPDSNGSGNLTNFNLATIVDGQKSDAMWTQNVFSAGEPGESLGQLALVGHQHDGRIYVFEINPESSGEFISHGFWETKTSEVCGLHWDARVADLVIWHGAPLDTPSARRVEGNSLEIWRLGGTHRDGLRAGEESDLVRRFELTDFRTGPDVPGNAGYANCDESLDRAHAGCNNESIAMVPRNGSFGAGPHQRMMFIVEDMDLTAIGTGDSGTDPWKPIRIFTVEHGVDADINDDGIVDAFDVDVMAEMILRQNMAFDINNDGTLDERDKAEMFEAYELEISVPIPDAK